MTLLSEFNGKTVAVIGLARSGAACAEVLTKLGARVQVYDHSTAAQVNPDLLATVRALGIEPHLGDVPLDYPALDYLITSPGVRRNAPILQDAVAAGVPVLGEIEAAYRIARAPILAITGTNGKTTTTVLLSEMLKAAGRETYVAGNIAAGEIALPLISAAYAAGPEAVIVAEISSFQLEWISTFRPRVAALLNITPDHGDRQSWDEYIASKWRIFENQTEEDAAILPGQYRCRPEFAPSLERLKAPRWWFETDSWQKRGVFENGGQVYLYTGHGKDIYQADVLCEAQEIVLPGRHNLENVCAAAAMAAAFGIAREPIRQVATTFTGVVHRLEFVETVAGVRYVNNSMCTNVAAFQKSLEALPEPKVVIAGGVFKGRTEELPQIAAAVIQNAVRALVLIGKSAPEIEAAARTAGYRTIQRAESLADAVEQARTLAQPGDTVLLAPACASFDMFQDFEDRGEQFKQCVHSFSG